MKKLALLLVGVLGTALCTFAKNTTEPVDYVSPLVGTQSKHALSTGNTYPAIAMPWGMNFWVAQTGKMGDGWAYTYDADKIRGFKQTHQPSPWINDYGQFAIMPVTGKVVFDQDQRASWFSHKAEVAKPYYYKVYLADHDVTTEIAPTSRAAMFRFTFPESNDSYVVVDAFDNGSYVKVIPEENKIIGYYFSVLFLSWQSFCKQPKPCQNIVGHSHFSAQNVSDPHAGRSLFLSHKNKSR